MRTDRWRRDRHWLGSPGAVLLAAAATAMAVAFVSCNGTSSTDGRTLTWAPPGGWRDFEELVIPTTGGHFVLEVDRDYRITAPEIIRGPVDIQGGRHIVWIGGHISIDYAGPHAPPWERRALHIGDHHSQPSHQGRIVHIEGLLIDGDDLAEGIDMSAPSATLQVQNVRVFAVSIRGADDRDGTNGYTDGLNHADVIQPWGGYGELRIDGLTGYSNYQGLYLEQDIGTPTQGDIYIRRMNIEAIQTRGEDGYDYAGHIMYRWDPAKTGQQFLESGTVWVKHHPNSGWHDYGVNRHAYRNQRGELVPDPPPGTSRFENNLYIFGETSTDSLGSYVTWDQSLNDGRPAVRNWTDTGRGRIYSGRPPSGDYVPESTVGSEYESPGYGDGEPPVTTVEARQDTRPGTRSLDGDGWRRV